MMARLGLTALLVIISVIHTYGAVQQKLQFPEASELVADPNEDLRAQFQVLQKNVSDIWTYISTLRTAVSGHLTHLRQHQAELESTVHRLEHFHEADGNSHMHGNLHGDSHHHSGEQHSHSGEHHSHSGEQHSHGSDHGSDQHSHGSDHGSDHHSHGSDHGSDHHSHSGEHHSHSGEHHSHSGEQHAHSQEHHSHSHSHSHTSHGDSKEDSTHSHSHDESHSHGSDHHHHHHDESHSHGGDQDQDPKNLHETEDLQQQTQQVATESGPVVEPIVRATTRREHYHHHHHDHDHGHSHGHSHGQASQSSSTSSSSTSNSLDLMNENSFHSHQHGHHDHGSHSHHHDEVSRSRNRTVEIPKYSDYAQYDFALCTVQPNRAIPEDKQQNVGGQVTLWQKKSGGPLNIHVRVQGFEMGDHHGHHGVQQSQQQQQDDVVMNETPQQEVGHKHGFHIHASGDLSDGCQSTGPHFNPKDVNHGGPISMVRHVGDLGNIECDNYGVTNILFSDDVASLTGPYSILGKAIVIHSDQDDFGMGGNPESLRTGNAGTRIACCVIQKVDKIPIRYYKAMKTASQYQNF